MKVCFETFGCRLNRAEALDQEAEYLAAGCSQADTAARMHIHLNTLKYRLQRICEITGADFKDQEEVFYLQLSSRILPNM